MKAKCKVCDRWCDSFLAAYSPVDGFSLKMIPYCSEKCYNKFTDHYYKAIDKGKTEEFKEYYNVGKENILPDIVELGVLIMTHK
jgi:hypothetical protein